MLECSLHSYYLFLWSLISSKTFLTLLLTSYIAEGAAILLNLPQEFGGTTLCSSHTLLKPYSKYAIQVYLLTYVELNFQWKPKTANFLHLMFLFSYCTLYVHTYAHVPSALR